MVVVGRISVRYSEACFLPTTLVFYRHSLPSSEWLWRPTPTQQDLGRSLCFAPWSQARHHNTKPGHCSRSRHAASTCIKCCWEPLRREVVRLLTPAPDFSRAPWRSLLRHPAHPPSPAGHHGRPYCAHSLAGPTEPAAAATPHGRGLGQTSGQGAVAGVPLLSCWDGCAAPGFHPLVAAALGAAFQVLLLLAQAHLIPLAPSFHATALLTSMWRSIAKKAAAFGLANGRPAPGVSAALYEAVKQNTRMAFHAMAWMLPMVWYLWPDACLFPPTTSRGASRYRAPLLVREAVHPSTQLGIRWAASPRLGHAPELWPPGWATLPPPLPVAAPICGAPAQSAASVLLIPGQNAAAPVPWTGLAGSLTRPRDHKQQRKKRRRRPLNPAVAAAPASVRRRVETVAPTTTSALQEA